MGLVVSQKQPMLKYTFVFCYIFFSLLFMTLDLRFLLYISQPPFAGSLGHNVSSPIQPVLERAERMQTPLSIGNHVSISCQIVSF